MVLRELSDRELRELLINLTVGPPRGFGKTELWDVMLETVRAEIDIRAVYRRIGRKELMAVEGYNGVCPICGSRDGTIISCTDGKYRNVCRVIGCSGYYTPLPESGYDTIEDCKKLINGEPLMDQYAKIKESK